MDDKKIEFTFFSAVGLQGSSCRPFSCHYLHLFVVSFVAVIALAACGTLAAEDSPPLPTFAEACFQARPAGSFLSLADAQAMLEGVGGESRLIRGDHEKVRLRGLFRIRDWTPEKALRLAFAEQVPHLRIHVRGDGHGISVFLPPAGAAYRTTEGPGEVLPRQIARWGLATLVATDDRRGRRLPPGAYQVRCQDGAVVVTKGNARLLTAALEGPAKAIYIESPQESTLQDLALLRTGPVPEESSPTHRIVLDGRQPAGLPWKQELPAGARFRDVGDRGVELVTEHTAGMAMASVAVAEPGLYEVIAEIDDATPGTGIALLNAKDEPLEGIEFGRLGKEGLAFGFGNPRQPFTPGGFNIMNGAVPLAGPRQWLRLVVAGGSSQCWVSGDGLHWGRVLGPHDCYGSWQTVALYARQSEDRRRRPDAPRHIRLRSVQVRELSGLAAAVNADLLAKAAAAGVAMKTDQNESPQAWTRRIAGLVPAGTSPAEWRYACTLQALAAAVQTNVAEWLLHHAVSGRMDELRLLPEKIDLLQDAALVWPPSQGNGQRQLALWERLGREVLNAGSRADFQLYQQALLQTSLGEPPPQSGPISWELARDALICYYAQHRATDLTRMEDLLLFWRANDPQVSGWPAGQQLDALLQWLNVRPLKRQRRQRVPVLDVARAVTPPLNRSACNMLAELQTALDAKQYADAGRIQISSEPPARAAGAADEGLVLSPEDDQLFISFRLALRLLALEHPAFCEAMVQQIGPADQLKIEQALVQGDPAAVDALSVQYGGTPAAVAPCQWLGDRALAAADPARAAAWYDEGLRWASPAQQPDLAARKRLAWAMLGAAWGQPPAQPVSFGGVKVAPQQFEGWVREQLSRRRTAAEAIAADDSLPVVAAAQPVLYEGAPFGQLDDREGRGFQGGGWPGEFGEVDWTWRHLALHAGEDALLAVERSRIAAFDLRSGKPRWDFRLGNSWSRGPVRPLVCGQRICLRAVTARQRMGVACLDARTGRTLWLGDCGGAAAGDPLWNRGRLFVLTIGPAGGQFVSPLCLVELNPETGEVVSRQQIAETPEAERLAGECQACWAGNRLVVLLAGSVICTDLQGRVLWLRQEATLPYTVDPASLQQYCQPAIVTAAQEHAGLSGPAKSASQARAPGTPPSQAGKPDLREAEVRLIVQQPGSCCVDCLALETSQRRWRRGIIGLQRIFDLPDDRLLVKTARGLVALNKTTGEVLWQRELPGMFSALARTSAGLVLAARQATIDDKPALVFLWIDAATGQTRAHGPLPMAKNLPVFCGPLAVRGDRTWCCLGPGAASGAPTAENPKHIVELRPGRPAPAGDEP